MNISVKMDIKAATKGLSNLQKRQIPFATSQALNDTAFQARTDAMAGMDKHLEKPTPWTKRGIRVGKSTKAKLVSSVAIEPDRWKYLRFQVSGGTRQYKTDGTIVTPKAINKNKYGNISRGRIKNLIASKRAFVGTVRGVYGVWQRPSGKTKGVRLLARFEDQATYTKRYPFARIVADSVRKNFKSNFARRLGAALAGGKR